MVGRFLRNPMGLVLILWLALAPALAAAHQLEHVEAGVSSELGCALCQVGDRSDGGLVPDAPQLPEPAAAILPASVHHDEPAILVEHRQAIRAPPVQG